MPASDFTAMLLTTVAGECKFPSPEASIEEVRMRFPDLGIESTATQSHHQTNKNSAPKHAPLPSPQACTTPKPPSMHHPQAPKHAPLPTSTQVTHRAERILFNRILANRILRLLAAFLARASSRSAYAHEAHTLTKHIHSRPPAIRYQQKNRQRRAVRIRPKFDGDLFLLLRPRDGRCGGDRDHHLDATAGEEVGQTAQVSAKWPILRFSVLAFHRVVY
jgi:hypothetical protein